MQEIRKLQALKSFNRLRQEEFNRVRSPCRNGIACPECGVELYDSNSSPVKFSYEAPPKKKIYCANCDFWGHRLS